MTRKAVSGGQYSPLAQAEIRQIHAAALDILATTGVKVANPVALGIFKQAGARITGETVYLDQAMIEDALAVVPHEVLLAGRIPDEDLLLCGKRVHFGTGGSPALVVDEGDHPGIPWREARLRDVRRLAALTQKLPELDFFVLPVTPTDIPLEAIAVNRFYAALTQTSKHIMGGLINLEGARQVHALGTLLAGSVEALRQRPFISCMTSWMVSPLTFDPHVVDILTFWTREGLPVALSAAPMAGSTAPVTLAGSLVQLNAEQLSGLVYTQLVRRGTPVLLGYIPGQMNLRTGGYLGGTPEFGLMQAAAAQLAQFYDVPLYCSAGMTDTKTPDAQAGMEKMLTLLLTALSGASFIHHAAGMLENMSMVSYEQMALDNDLILQVKRVLGGIQVNEGRLGVEAIQRVGSGGNYLSDEHTLEYMRGEFVQPALMERGSRDEWLESGAKDARQRACQRVKSLLQEFDAVNAPVNLMLDEEVDRQVRERFGNLS
jgi:trimethylamine--corrinoid protein Co-methyltransferase